jgi:hypothetical protein
MGRDSQVHGARFDGAIVLGKGNANQTGANQHQGGDQGQCRKTSIRHLIYSPVFGLQRRNSQRKILTVVQNGKPQGSKGELILNGLAMEVNLKLLDFLSSGKPLQLLRKVMRLRSTSACQLRERSVYAIRNWS